jgi:integrase
MPRPTQDVRVYGVQDRRSRSDAVRPWIVRYTIDARHRSRAFRTRAEAERFRGLLLRSVSAGERFDEATGEPQSWSAPLGQMRVHDWARRWLSGEWHEWQPRTRSSAAEGLSRFVALAVSDLSTPPEGLRRYLRSALRPDVQVAINDEYEKWLARFSLPIGELNRERVAAIDRQLALKLDGTAMAANTATRTRVVARAFLHAAVDAGAIDVDPWPQRSKARGQRKVARRRRSVDVRSLPTPAVMSKAIDAIVTHQPGSRTYRVMTAVAYYAGLRPSEVVMLRRKSLHLPSMGWGRIDVKEADISLDEPGEPKTGPRTVPIPRVLVKILSEWLELLGVGVPEDLIFRTRNGKLPSASNWGRAWHRALASVGLPPLRVYDCRHAAATTWLRAGVPLAETARRMGHSVETLVSTYVGALDDEERVANERIDRTLGAVELPDPVASCEAS